MITPADIRAIAVAVADELERREVMDRPIPLRPIDDEVTNDFVECFGQPEERSGPMWDLLKKDILRPEGVNYDDPRVVHILSTQIRPDEVVT